VFVDSRKGTVKDSGDVILSRSKIYTGIGEAFAGNVSTRATETTILKSPGMALEDIATAPLGYRPQSRDRHEL
jgi:ornithine cyclodeaminase/alanine dehydrogenase-like protein (mu-crystallin family)